MDFPSREWFHAFKENSMKPFERQPDAVALTAASGAVALVVVVLASMLVQ
jgi:hypothetical protein